MRMLICMSCLLSFPLFAHVPLIEAPVETAPIPAGVSDSDDTAVWMNAENPAQSIILGTSKYDEDGQGGLGVYDLEGRQLQFFAGSKLNSVDIIGDLAVASNRSEKSFDVYKITDGVVSFVSRTLLSIEPYGLCLDPALNVYLPTKSGVLYQYGLDGRERGVYDLGSLVSKKQDEFITSIVTKEAAAEGEEDELEEHLAERFILEGCAYDDATGTLYVGMENFGIWSIIGKKVPQLVIPVQGSWTDIDDWNTEHSQPRVTDDVEGIDILHRNGRSYMIFSSQGISEFTVYDLSDERWLGNFKVQYGDRDPVTFTDGVSVKGGYFSPAFPDGLLVVHDDENTDHNGTLQPGNYKLISLADIWKSMGH